FKYYNVSIIFVDQDSGDLTLRASAGAYEGGSEIGTAAKVASGIASSVAQTGEPLMLNDVPNDPTYCCDEGLGNTQAELAVPIKIGGRTIGVLDIEADRIDAFDELDLFTAQTLADQLAIAIENARLYEHAQELATVEERQRLARDLHDAVTQTLFSASLIAEVLPRLWEKNPDEGRRRLEELRRSTRGALAEMRMLLMELRPAALTEANLGELLQQMTDAAIGKVGIPFDLTVEGQGALPADVQITFYRVAQEALNNIQKHASASKVSLTLRYQPESVTLVISDDGAGFDPDSVSSEHLGLSIMCERAETIGAECKVESEIGHGTRVKVMWRNPL
ncbi:histidine kinase, partial [Chloroflexota bacterium]